MFYLDQRQTLSEERVEGQKTENSFSFWEISNRTEQFFHPKTKLRLLLLMMVLLLLLSLLLLLLTITLPFKRIQRRRRSFECGAVKNVLISNTMRQFVFGLILRIFIVKYFKAGIKKSVPPTNSVCNEYLNIFVDL